MQQCPVGQSCSGSVLLTSNTTNAKIGDRSRVPPKGGISPRKRFKYGSAKVLHRKSIRWCILNVVTAAYPHKHERTPMDQLLLPVHLETMSTVFSL